MHTNLICRVERYDNSTGIGDLEPLFLDDEGNPLPLIINARAVHQRFKIYKRIVLEGGSINHSGIPDGGTSHTINNGDNIYEFDQDYETHDVKLYPEYLPGDLVLACVTERDMADAIIGNKGNGDGKEPFQLSSAIIIGLVGD